jgi:multisubunit Na+/H+ antiporter MnhE subunit
MRALGWWTIGWLSLAALWLLYQGEWNAIQIYAAAAAAALSLLVAFVLRRHVLPATRVERRWLVRTARIPWQVVREFGIVTLFLVRRRPREGEFRRLPFPAGGARPADRGRRVFIALATGYSPNSYVLDVDEEQGEVLVHVLGRVPRGQELV